MKKSYNLFLSLLCLVSIMISGCATKPDNTPEDINHIATSHQRAKLLLNNKKWRLNGKIAFIQQTKGKSKRESASITWQVNENNKTQELNLTSYLGINVLHLQSNNGQHLIKVDGEEYQGNNLSSLIYSLTGLTLPTQALNFWLKGLPYKTEDKLQLNEKTQLPKRITSFYHNTTWQIDYNKYQRFNGLFMATQFTIKKDDLLIKIAVKNWSFLD
jgi:outer membrane lipoprotein LolB